MTYGLKVESLFFNEKGKILHERIDDLACFLSSPSGPNLSRRYFKQLVKDFVPASTHEFDAWSDRGARR